MEIKRHINDFIDSSRELERKKESFKQSIDFKLVVNELLRDHHAEFPAGERIKFIDAVNQSAKDIFKLP